MTSHQRIKAITASGVRLALPTEPLVCSSSRHWEGFVLERHRVPPGQLPQHVLADHCFLLPMGLQAVAFQCQLDGAKIRGDIVPGKIQFRSVGTAVSTQWYSPLDGIFMSVAPSAVQAAIYAPGEGAPVSDLHSDLDPQLNPGLLQITLALETQIRTPQGGGRLLEEALLHAICANLAVSYGGPAPQYPRSPSLSRQTLVRVHEFIHDHLTTEFAIRDIAAAACLSPYYLSRAYRLSTGRTLWQYVIQCRAALAFDLLSAHPDEPLDLIAEHAGFESYAQFAAAFRKWYGMRPGDFRRRLR